MTLASSSSYPYSPYSLVDVEVIVMVAVVEVSGSRLVGLVLCAAYMGVQNQNNLKVCCYDNIHLLHSSLL